MRVTVVAVLTADGKGYFEMLLVERRAAFFGYGIATLPVADSRNGFQGQPHDLPLFVLSRSIATYQFVATRLSPVAHLPKPWSQRITLLYCLAASAGTLIV